jgi:hypothetical protein
VRQLPNARPERRLIVARRPPIPGRSTELRQVTGPHAADREGGVHPGGQLAALCGPQTFFSQGLGQDVLVERQVGDDLLQAGILVFERSEP